jgi:hypothetical protein
MVYSGDGEKCILIPSTGDEYVNYYDLYNKRRKFMMQEELSALPPKIYEIRDKGEIANIIHDIKSEFTNGFNYIKHVACKANSLINNDAFTVYPTNDFKTIREYKKKY